MSDVLEWPNSIPRSDLIFGRDKPVIQFRIDGEALITISDKGFFAKDMNPIMDSGELYMLFKEVFGEMLREKK